MKHKVKMQFLRFHHWVMSVFIIFIIFTQIEIAYGESFKGQPLYNNEDYSDKITFGKVIGNDFYEGKVTLPIIMLYQKSSEAERSTLKEMFNRKERKTQELTYTLNLMTKYQIIASCKKRAEHFSSVSADSLGIFPESKEKTRLQELAFYIVNRIN